MERVPRVLLRERAKEALVDAIRTGSLAGKLPGHRELCRVFGISRSSLEPALADLVADGILLAGGARRRFEVVDDHLKLLGTGTRRKILFLEPNITGRPTPIVSDVAAKLRSRLDGDYWQVASLSPEIDQSHSNKRRLQAILDTEQPDFLVLVGGHRKTVEWVMDCGVPFGCFGGDVRAFEVPAVSYGAEEMLRAAVTRLLAAGHRDLFMPLLVRSEGFVESMRSTMESMLREAGVEFSAAWNTPILNRNDADSLWEVIRRRFEQKAPTAMIGFGPTSAQLAFGFAAHHGIRVPAKLSLVMLGRAHDLPWLLPQISAFEFPVAPVVSRMMRWIRPGAPPGGHGKRVIPPVWCEGGTIRDLRQAGPA